MVSAAVGAAAAQGAGWATPGTDMAALAQG